MKNFKTIKKETYTLPSYWASALINGDESGMSDDDIKEMNNWLDRVKPGSCVDVSDEQYIARFNGLITDVSDYTFIEY